MASDTLAGFSIANVPDGSNLFWIHVACAYFVTAATFYMLYNSYKKYVLLTQDFYASPCDATEYLRRRTIMIRNIPLRYSSKEKLQRWLKTIKIGEVDNIHMNTVENQDLIQAIKEYDIVLNRLEIAYMDWAVNIYNYVECAKFVSIFPTGPATRSKLSEHEMTEASKLKCTPELLKKAKPRLIGLEFNSEDAIKHYTAELRAKHEEASRRRSSKAETAIHMEQPVSPLMRSNSFFSKSYATSAYVTFKSPRSAYYAVQLQLYGGTDGYSMDVKDVPAPNEIKWDNLTRPYIDKFAISTLISTLTFILTLVWVVPSYYLAGLSVTGIAVDETTNAMVLKAVKAVLPPVIVGIIAGIMPGALHSTEFLRSTITDPEVRYNQRRTKCNFWEIL